MTETHANLTAYEGVESLERFSGETLGRYCDEKLDSCDKYVAFIRAHFPARPLRVLEIGSGSGKLLLRFEREGMLERGVGYEVSGSRCLFAARFARHCGSSRVEFRNADFVESDLGDAEFDVVIGIDVVANLIGAISPDHTAKMLGKIASCLAEAGAGVLELMTCDRELGFVRLAAGGAYRTWKRFDESDPFIFGLDEMSTDSDGNLVWDKNFLSATGEMSEFRNILKPFPEERFREEVAAQGLRCEVFPEWAAGDDTVDQEYVALIRRV